ncbi:hypothetical protein SLNWT_2957 [Streptomyces albus]|uniref:Uncharacterized protein n=1 Tax=Streptomyces albus (strain ATCC 21838 / DSM 41398 / FERM P-419 / JCM 4703 / NBRC 107858) TaxID=1081613 RepID=A0A0B5ELR0_STRA4|nr:hypothetical protein SLNWT_2957 [Streptomyces albus]
MSVRPVATADLVDEYGTRLEVPEVQFRQVGGAARRARAASAPRWPSAG